MTSFSRENEEENEEVEHNLTQKDTPEREVSLPLEAKGLSEQLIRIARRYLHARRRQGEALLEAALCLSEARAVADEGTWYLFLKVTATSHDVAERLLNIHLAANRDTRFAEAVVCGRLNQTVAGLLARPSTPPQVLDSMLSVQSPPRVIDVQRAMREAHANQGASYVPHGGNVDNPHNAGQRRYGYSYHDSSPPWLTPVCEQLARSRTALLSIHGEIAGLDDSSATNLAREVGHVLDAIEHISKALQQRRIAKKRT